MNGLRPIAEFMTINFAFLALDAIVNHAAKIHYMFGGNIKVPVVFRAPGGGGRQLGATHSHTPDVIFAHFPGLKVVSPGTPYDAKGLLKSAIRSDDPVLFIEHATLYQLRGEVPEDEDFTVPIGISEVKREGSDVTIAAYAKGLQVAMDAADDLAKQGIEAEVVDLRTLRPLDIDPVLASFKKTFKAVVVEEGYRSYGIGAEITARIQEEGFDYLDGPIKRVAQAEVPLPYSQELEQSALINVKRVVDAVKEIV
jgi:pyruvate dehydrogenase E1 component beta subunit